MTAAENGNGGANGHHEATETDPCISIEVSFHHNLCSCAPRISVLLKFVERAARNSCVNVWWRLEGDICAASLTQIPDCNGETTPCPATENETAKSSKEVRI